MGPEVLLKVRFLSDLTEGPEGLPLFLLTEIQEGEPPKYLSRLALFDGALRFLTQEEARKPRYAHPYVYFLRRVGEVQELFRLDLRGGEAERLTQTAGVLDYALGPEGQVAFLALKEAPKPGLPRTFSGWPFKLDGRGLLPEGQVALYLLHGGEVRLLLDRYPAPKEMVFAPEGLYLVMPEDPQAQAGWRDTLYRLREGGLEKVWGGVGPIFALEWSPEGLFFLGHAFERGGGTEARLYHLRDGGVRVLLEGSLQNSVNADLRFGAHFQGPKWTEEGVYLVRTEGGEGRLYRVGLDGQAEALSASGSVLAFARTPKGLFLLTEDFTRPARLEGPLGVYDPNEGLSLPLAEPQATAWQSPEGHRVPGWVLLPEGEGPHPVILYIHGGPHTAFGRAPMLEFALYRQAGYAVAFANPRGSTGYGQDFALLEGAWGERDERDLLGFLDHVLAHFPLDPERVGVAGGSYGGYMTNWLTARHPGRFKAAVTDRSICNWLSFFGASDIGPRFTYLELFAKPWERPEVLWEKSPLRYVHQVRTPTLVVHAEGDHRCPMDQGETWYTALWHLGVKTRFLRVPEEGHELSRSGRPDRRLARLRAYLDWWRENL
ncbi:Acylamino-acid-releasing enzyme [Thermus sp. CCB_US3_UF1]|uniref:S9 family peptidase n=1 Tax=Thermus sp. CCB_US3_UF1 TaxID=1111069 RepID=UPI000238A0F5|nr:S9 family peptidase [Thermus sp. CCB_US3_UF1]AEV15614.1 Acylamino-acid-releasing enzyme [Thermus sp. CCB_US3_UF1]